MKYEIKNLSLEEILISHIEFLKKNGFENPKISSALNFKYYISSNGLFASAITPALSLRNTPKILKKRFSSNGYEIICLEKRNLLAHRIIAREYLGDTEGFVVHHKNGDRKDNRVENLEITNYSKNNSESFNTRRSMHEQFIKMCLEHFKRNNK